MESIREGGSFYVSRNERLSLWKRLERTIFCPKRQQKTFRRIKQKNIGKTVDIADENGYYITVARPTQG